MKRPILIEGNVAYVQLTQGYEAVIDAKNVHLVSGQNWSADISRRRDGSVRVVYAVCVRQKDGAKTKVYMHREIMSADGGCHTDHIDGDGLNNREVNLRPATPSQNARNSRAKSSNTSGAKGVSFHKQAGKWTAMITVDRVQAYLGLYDSIEEAADAYATASAKLHGEFGRTS